MLILQNEAWVKPSQIYSKFLTFVTQFSNVVEHEINKGQ